MTPKDVGQTGLVDSYTETPTLHGRSDYVPYDKRKLSYANTFHNPWQANTIRVLEWLTGKLRLLRLIRKFERQGVVEGQGFWAPALKIMGIDLLPPDEGAFGRWWRGCPVPFGRGGLLRDALWPRG